MGLLIMLWDGSLKYGAVAYPTNIPLPADVTVDSCLRPSPVTSKGRTVILGKYHPGLVVDESLSAWRLGINGPSSPPTLTGTGTGVTTGSCVGYFTFAHKIGGVGGKLVARSNLSPPSPSVTLTAQKRKWDDIPTIAPDLRTNVVETWVSFAGGLPRHGADVPLGTSSYIEDIPILSLGAFTPINNGIVTYNRYPPPACSYLANYRSRFWYGGDGRYPYRVWYTPIGELEGVGLATYLDTRDKEAVTAMGSLDDHLLVLGRKVAYAVQGLGITGSDFEIEKVSPTVGCVCHAGIINIHRRLFFPAQDNIYMYDGAFHPLLTDKFQQEYAADYKESPDSFHDACAADDRQNQCYLLQTPRVQGTGDFGNGTYTYVVNYSGFIPEAGGAGGVEVMDDIRCRRDSCLVTTTAASPEVLYVGSEDGFVRTMNVDDDVDDDADGFAKTIILRHPHFFFGEQRGDERDGKTFVEFFAHLESENVATTIKVWCGDERAADGDPFKTMTFGPGAVTGRVIKSLYNTILERCTGRGISVEVEVSSPDKDWRYRGFSGTFLPGVSLRGGTEPARGQQG